MMKWFKKRWILYFIIGTIIGALIIDFLYRFPYTIFYTPWGSDATLGYWGASLGAGVTIIAIVSAIRTSRLESASAHKKHIHIIETQMKLQLAQNKYSLLIGLTREYLNLLDFPCNEDFYLVDGPDKATFKRLLSHPHKVNTALRNFMILLFDSRQNMTEEDTEFMRHLESLRKDYLVIYEEFRELYIKSRQMEYAETTGDHTEINSIKAASLAIGKVDPFHSDVIKQEADRINHKLFQSQYDDPHKTVIKDIRKYIGEYLKSKQDEIDKLVDEIEVG